MEFREYYTNIYLPAHKKMGTRILHFIGVTLTLVWLIFAVFLNLIWMILLAPFIVYPFAWLSHMLIEKNKPLAWSNPWIAKVADMVMCYEMLTGRLDWGE